MELREKIVDFEKYCKICEYKDYPDEAIPCCYCLDNPTNQESHTPTEFKKSKKRKQKEKIQEERKLLQSKSRMRLVNRG